MRQLSSNAVAQVATHLGGEPLVIVAVFWDGVNPHYYCDRGAFQSLPQLEGKILKMAGLDDVVNISNSSNSQSVSIMLDDTDQSIKNIYNVLDVHKKPVIIYQWFTQLNFSDKFIIFEGVINSPIVWVEKERTLSFDIVSLLEDAEIGYSPEEGDYANLADDLIGKPWPLPFGTVRKIPAILIDTLSNCILMDSIGMHDPGLGIQIGNLLAKAIWTQNVGINMIIQGGLLQFTGDFLKNNDQESETGDFLPPGDGGGNPNVTPNNNANGSLSPTGAADNQSRALDATTAPPGTPTVTIGDTDAGGQLISRDPETGDPSTGGGTTSNSSTSGSSGGQDTTPIDSSGGGPETSPATFTTESNDPLVQQGKQMVQAGNQLLAQAYQMMLDASKISKQLQQQLWYEHQGYGTPPPPIQTLNPAAEGYRDPNLPDPGPPTPYIKGGVLLFNGLTFPQGQTARFEIGGKIVITGHISAAPGNPRGDSILWIDKMERKDPVVIESIAPQYAWYNSNPGQKMLISPGEQQLISGGGFLFEKAGSQVRWASALPTRWITAQLPCTVLGVFAIRDYGGTKLMTAVPTNFYSVSTPSFVSQDGGPGITATMITLTQPLTYIEGGGWEDQIFVDLISPVGPNTVGILSWMIATYSQFGWDSTSFTNVANQLSQLPMNFCLFERKNLIQALQEIAFQARCAIYLKENLFYLIYLVPERASVDTITLDDIIYGSLELHHTPTEQIVTKFVANYKIYYAPQTGWAASDIGQKEDKIILRSNLKKYGLHEQQYAYYAYTDPWLVDLSSTFWIIRKSNTWKLIQFKTPLHKINLETFDSITINFASNWAFIGAMTGCIVNSAKLDTDAMEITFEVWVPVRLGEMTKYPGGNPTKQFFYPTIHDQPGSNNIGETSGGQLQSARNPNGVTISFPKGGRKGLHSGNTKPGDDNNPQDDPITTPQDSVGNLDPTERPNFPPAAARNYDLNTRIDPALAVNKTFPAQILGQASEAGAKYKVRGYPKGLTGKSVTTGAIDASFNPNKPNVLKAGTWVMVSQLVWTEKKGGTSRPNQCKYFVPGGAPASSTFPGVVTGGSGDTYTVSIYKNGLAQPPESVSVKQLQISADTVPTGTWALIAEGKKVVPPGQDDKEYTMQVPVWVG